MIPEMYEFECCRCSFQQGQDNDLDILTWTINRKVGI
jgi:hypothetical protein